VLNGWAGVGIHGPVHDVVAVLRCAVKSAEEDGVDVGEVDREDRVSLRHQELWPRRGGAARADRRRQSWELPRRWRRRSHGRVQVLQGAFPKPTRGGSPLALSRLGCSVPMWGSWCWRRRRCGWRTARACRLRGMVRTSDADPPGGRKRSRVVGVPSPFGLTGRPDVRTPHGSCRPDNLTRPEGLQPLAGQSRTRPCRSPARANRRRRYV
jgi:hypothetical protein